MRKLLLKGVAFIVKPNHALYKYPRTPHVPFSEGFSDDDKRLSNMNHFFGKYVSITEKMDGENTTIYSDYYHARSLDSRHREYHSYLLNKVLPELQWQIPERWRVCGEYLYARHSIPYELLEDYFLCFSVWDNNNKCLSWEDTLDFCYHRDIHMVPVLYEGIYDEEKTIHIANSVVAMGGEGIVIRNVSSFDYKNFSLNVAKYVRANHVQTDNHWSFGKIEKNSLGSSEG